MLVPNYENKNTLMPLCPRCNKELHRVYWVDGIERWKCVCGPVIYSSFEYMISSGKIPAIKYETK